MATHLLERETLQKSLEVLVVVHVEARLFPYSVCVACQVRLILRGCHFSYEGVFLDIFILAAFSSTREVLGSF